MIRPALSISLDPLGRLTEVIETSDTWAVAGLQESSHGSAKSLKSSSR
jgi:hypothetical protein